MVEADSGFRYREDPVAEPRETFRLHGKPFPEDVAHREALQAARLAVTKSDTGDFRDTMRVRRHDPTYIDGEK